MPAAVSPKNIAERLTEHWSPRVVGEQEVQVLLFERKTTLHSGNEINSRTRSIEDQLRPV